MRRRYEAPRMFQLDTESATWRAYVKAAKATQRARVFLLVACVGVCAILFLTLAIIIEGGYRP